MIVILFTFHFRALAARDESYSGVTFYYVHYRDTRCPCSKPRTNKQSMCDCPHESGTLSIFTMQKPWRPWAMKKKKAARHQHPRWSRRHEVKWLVQKRLSSHSEADGHWKWWGLFDLVLLRQVFWWVSKKRLSFTIHVNVTIQHHSMQIHLDVVVLLGWTFWSIFFCNLSRASSGCMILR